MVCIDQLFRSFGIFLFILAVIIKMVLSFVMSNKYGYLKQHTTPKSTLERKVQIYSWILSFTAIFLIIFGGVMKFYLQKYIFCFPGLTEFFIQFRCGQILISLINMS